MPFFHRVNWAPTSSTTKNYVSSIQQTTTKITNRKKTPPIFPGRSFITWDFRCAYPKMMWECFFSTKQSSTNVNMNQTKINMFLFSLIEQIQTDSQVEVLLGKSRYPLKSWCSTSASTYFITSKFIISRHYNKTLWLTSLLASFLASTITFSVFFIIFWTKWTLFQDMAFFASLFKIWHYFGC